jgi:AmpD protein
MYDFESDSSDPERCAQVLDDNKVSAHYLISRRGKVFSLVPEKERAWHAGLSKMPAFMGGDEGVNDFSIGIELIAKDHQLFTKSQYKALSELTEQICRRFPIRYVVGHQDIALPKGRKSDPGERFDWNSYREMLEQIDKGTSKLIFGDKL